VWRWTIRLSLIYCITNSASRRKNTYFFKCRYPTLERLILIYLFDRVLICSVFTYFVIKIDQTVWLSNAKKYNFKLKSIELYINKWSNEKFKCFFTTTYLDATNVCFSYNTIETFCSNRDLFGSDFFFLPFFTFNQ
jgi:hypothetical protein